VKSRLVTILPWAFFGLLVVVWVAAVWFDRGSDEVTGLLDKLWALSFFAFPVVGVFLARRIPSNAVGWLFIVGPMLVGAGVALQEMAETRDLLALITPSEIVFDAGLLALFSSLTLFPEGRYRHRWWLWAQVLVILTLSLVAGSYLPVALILALIPLIYRLVRGDAITRRQIAGPFLVVLVGVLSLVTVGFLVPGATPLASTLTTAITMIITVGVPVSIAVAITRYRLYDIDRIISRTASYALLAGLLAAVFFGVVTVLTTLLPAESDLAVAGSTLAVAALFNPLRKRVQGWVDRRFNRSRYDTQRVMDGFAGSLRDELDTGRMVSGWIEVVSATMQPHSAGIWIRSGTLEATTAGPGARGGG